MKSRGRQCNAVAACLGLFALLVQTLVPLLIAGEIAVAAKAGDHSVLEFCPYGHLHRADPPGAPGDADKHHSDHGDLCPICLALHASPVFTAPVVAALPLPVVRAGAPLVLPQRGVPHLITVAGYRSRAPPNA